MVFSEVSVKAAGITGAAIGLFSSLFAVGQGYGMMPMYGIMKYSVMGYAYSGFGLSAIIVLTVWGAIIGALIAFVYNAALKI